MEGQRGPLAQVSSKAAPRGRASRPQARSRNQASGQTHGQVFRKWRPLLAPGFAQRVSSISLQERTELRSS